VELLPGKWFILVVALLSLVLPGGWLNAAAPRDRELNLATLRFFRRPRVASGPALYRHAENLASPCVPAYDSAENR
jgi:hypothetical protein